jgi:quercetin 2,3-dioxygenase
MITLRRATERRHDQRGEQEAWLTFYPGDRAAALAGGFGALEALNEVRLPPGAGLRRHPQHGAEIITYVREGALVSEDAMGRSGVIHTGEFQRMTDGRGVRHSETNAASQADWAHAFQIWLRPSEGGLAQAHEHKRFSVADRRGGLCLVASPDGRRGSLRIHLDALMFAAMLDRGQHVVHELARGRGAWLHLVQGAVTLGDIVMATGDGAGVTAERALSITAREGTEILLFDLVEPCQRGR